MEIEINIGETTSIIASASTNENLSTQMQEINETINILTRPIPTLNAAIQRRRPRADQLRASIESLITHSSVAPLSYQDQNARINDIQHDQETFQQYLATARQTVEEGQSTSHDGTLIWKISNVREKMGKY